LQEYEAEGDSGDVVYEGRRCLVSEDASWRQAWDVLNLVLVVFTCAIVPTLIAWPRSFASRAWSIWFIATDGYFLIDVGLNFVTTYRECAPTAPAAHSHRIPLQTVHSSR
jgi:hypothetical protein